MSSEEDASVALQVSNALTQALLQFRMNNLPQEVCTNKPIESDHPRPLPFISTNILTGLHS